MATPTQQTSLVTVLSIAFYNQLSSFVRSIPKHNILIISGDMDTQIGKTINNKFSLYNSSNREH